MAHVPQQLTQHPLENVLDADTTKLTPGANSHRGACFDEQFFKTQLCTFWQAGRCFRQACKFAHGQAELRSAPDLSRTSMCRVAIQGGTCQDPTCGYAHHLNEVRATNSYFKTVMCRFARYGTCKLGRQCRYAHTSEELRPRRESDDVRLPIEPGGPQDLNNELSFERDVSQDQDDIVFSMAVTAEWPAEVEWEDEIGSEQQSAQDSDHAHSDAADQLWHSQQGGPQQVDSAGRSQLYQEWTCTLSSEVPVRFEHPSDRMLLCGKGMEARKPIFGVTQHLDGSAQKQKQSLMQPSSQLQQQRCQLQQSSHQLLAQSTAMPAQPCLDSDQRALIIRPNARNDLAPHGVDLTSSRRLSTKASVPCFAGPHATPQANAAQVRENMPFSFGAPGLGSPAAFHTLVTTEQAPNWEPTIPAAALATTSVQESQLSHSEAVNPAEALLREMQASILKAAMPEHYED